MSDQDFKKALNSFLGLTPEDPEEEIRPILKQWEKMRSPEAMPEDLKDKGWQEILRKRHEYSEKSETNPKSLPNLQKFINSSGAYLKIAVAALLLVVVSVMIRNNFLQRETTNRYNSALLVSSENQVTANHQFINEGDTVHSGEILESPGGSYRLKFSDAVVLDVQYKSRLRFFEKDGTTFIDLQEGALAAVVNSAKKPNRLVFSTPTGNIHVKGTVFYERVMSPDETYFCICHGTVKLAIKNESRVVSAAHHAAFSMVRKQGEEKIISDTMKYHQDPLLEDMGRSIDYHIDWKSEP